MAQIDRLFDMMLQNGASDLHLAQGQPPKFRLHGEITLAEGYSVLEADQIQTYLREICTTKYWEKYEEKGDLDFAYAYESKARFRANYLKQYYGYGAVFRIIPSKIFTLEDLGAPPVLQKFASWTSGLCLVTGPTGSGKSTTLAAIIDMINTTSKRVVLTIEEPIEFVHPQKQSTIIQREVGQDALSFGQGLHGATRQDVDVILVGEMRDLETNALAVAAAEMGTLVFGTLHTNSAIKTVDRIVDIFPFDQRKAVRESLASALQAVCAQLLLRKKGGAGRVACHEILIQTRAVSNMIRDCKTSQLKQVMMSSRAMGMQVMEDAIEALLQQEIIDGREAYLKATEKDRFKQYAHVETG